MAHILLMDRVDGVRHTVSAMLGRGGHTVVLARNGAAGRAAMRTQRFDLVIADLLVPEQDGSEMMGEIARLASPPKVIAMLADGTGETARQAAQLRADAFLEKPVAQNLLLSTVDTLLPAAA